MITDYEKEESGQTDIPDSGGGTGVYDPDLLYYYDFSDTNYTEEKISKDSLYQLYESDLTTIRPQFTDIYGLTGVKASAKDYNSGTYLEANNNNTSFPIGALDNISQENLTFRYEYSVEGGFDLWFNISSKSTYLFLEPAFLYRFGTSPSSTDPDDALQPSGISSQINCKDVRQYVRAMNTDPSNSTFNISSFRPVHTSFYSAIDAYDHPVPAVQGLFPYCVNGTKHQLAFGYRTKDDGNKYFFFYHNKTYVEKLMGSSSILTHYNRHLPLIKFRERENDGICNLHSIKVYNRFLEAEEFDDVVHRFPFLYHFVVNAYYSGYANLQSVIQANHESYLQFNDNCPMRIQNVVRTWDLTQPIWYEYELELVSGTSTFALEFFNLTSSQNSVYDALTTNFFNTTYLGIAFGVDKNQFLKYKAGSTIIQTTTTFPLNTKKYLSFYYTSTEIKFYYDKALLGTVLRTDDDTLFTHIEGTTSSLFNFGVFNLDVSGNRCHFLCRHTNNGTDLGTADNSVF